VALYSMWLVQWILDQTWLFVSLDLGIFRPDLGLCPLFDVSKSLP